MNQYKDFIKAVHDPNAPRNILKKFIVPQVFATAPQTKPEHNVNSEAARRLLINQLLVMSLQSNTYALVDRFTWPSSAAKLIGALNHRIDDLFSKFFTFTSSQQGEWLNQVNSIMESAVVSVLAIAEQKDPAKNAQLSVILTELAKLAGTYQEDEQEGWTQQ